MREADRGTRSRVCLLAVLMLSVLYAPYAKSGLADSPVKTWLDEQSRSGFAGALLVARGDKVLRRENFGLADKETGKPYSADTVVDILSLTKQITAAAVLKLQEQGALSVDDTLGRFFKNVPDDKSRITIHQLLTHTSGLRNSLGGDYSEVTRDAFEARIWKSKLQFPPGKEYSYSNVGYGLLGIIIELASGKSYEEFLNEHIFQPAGMTWTGYSIPNWKSQDIAVGYHSHAKGFHGWLARVKSWFGAGDRWGTPLDQHWSKDGPWWNLHANGGMLSTLNDLHRWHLALENDAVLSAGSKDRLFFPHVRTDKEGHTYYGYGWVVGKKDGKISEIYHDGGNPYFFSLFYHSVEHDLLLIFATNSWGTVRSGEINKLVEAVIKEYYLPKNPEDAASQSNASKAALVARRFFAGVRIMSDTDRL